MKIRVVNKALGGLVFYFLGLFQRNPIKYKIFEILAAGICVSSVIVLKLSAFKERRMQGHSRIGQKRVMIQKEVKGRHTYPVPEIFKRGSQFGH